MPTVFRFLEVYKIDQFSKPQFAELDQTSAWNTPRPSRSFFAPPPDTSSWLSREAATVVGWTDRILIVLYSAIWNTAG